MERAERVAQAVKEEVDDCDLLTKETQKALEDFMSRHPATPCEKVVWAAQHELAEYQAFVNEMSTALNAIFNAFNVTRVAGGPEPHVTWKLLNTAVHISNSALEHAKAFAAHMEPLRTFKNSMPAPEKWSDRQAELMKIITEMDSKAREEVERPAVGAACAKATIELQRTPAVQESSADALLSAAAATASGASSLTITDEEKEEKERAAFLFG